MESEEMKERNDATDVYLKTIAHMNPMMRSSMVYAFKEGYRKAQEAPAKRNFDKEFGAVNEAK